jgi:cytochrome c biogenesis protein CcmG/thiol:disulfide interchange protein DsbE
MNRFWIPLGVFALLCVVFAVALHRAPDKQFVKSALIGKPAADFVLPDLLKPDSVVDSRQFKGRWVLLNVWGSWCAKCKEEHPQLLAIQREGKVVVVGLNLPDSNLSQSASDAEARKWLEDLGNPYAAVPVDRESRTSLDYGVYGAPETFLINPQGIIVHKLVSAITPTNWQSQFLPLIDGAAK